MLSKTMMEMIAPVRERLTTGVTKTVTARTEKAATENAGETFVKQALSPEDARRYIAQALRDGTTPSAEVSHLEPVFDDLPDLYRFSGSKKDLLYGWQDTAGVFDARSRALREFSSVDGQPDLDPVRKAITKALAAGGRKQPDVGGVERFGDEGRLFLFDATDSSPYGRVPGVGLFDQAKNRARILETETPHINVAD